KFPGFLRVYSEAQEEAQEEGKGRLPELEEGQELKLVEVRPEQHFTQPPPRYTEAALIKTMEELGIGRPSTYAPIIETIRQRGYVEMKDRHFVPTELGFVVTDLLREYFPRVVDVDFTAELENKLDAIEEGKADWVQILREFYGPFQEALRHAQQKIGKISLPPQETDELCPACGRRLVIKRGRFGEFLACPGFPECRYTKPLLKSTGALCPRCGGEIVERRSKRGRVFYGCSNYPACGFTTWLEPVSEKCPRCGSFLVVRRRRGRAPEYTCANEECDYRRTAQEAQVQ
ncbi:MAG: DNA topoisomerase, partial [Bacillota bacterium]|nr:DNA topoisomerase [Bacillota bacterium]